MLKYLIICILFLSIASYSQITIQAGGGIGFVMPSGDFSGSTIDYYNGTQYGLANGFNLHGKIRVGLLGVGLKGEVGYSDLRNSGNYKSGEGKIEIKQQIITLKAGPEFQINIPLLPVKPYIGANLALNNFSGESKFQGVSKISSGTYTVESASRFGIGFEGGAIVKLNPLMGLDISLQYNMMNLAGKNWTDKNPAKDERIDTYLALNDDKDPLFGTDDSKHVVSGTRSINSILLTVSLMFGL